MDKNTLWAMVIIAFMGTLFGAFALYLGYDSVVISSLFGFLGAIAGAIGGYTLAKKEEIKEEI